MLQVSTPSSHAQAQSASGVTADSLIDEIDGLVRERYFAPQQLERVGWDGAVVRARRALARSGDAASRSSVINGLLATLKTSHTSYYSQDDPAYWQLAGIFERVIERTCAAEKRPALPITVTDVGVFWKRIGSSWFAGGVYAGGPADAAGFKVGDEVVRANGKAFSPVTSFAGQANTPVTLDVRRQRRGPTMSLVVVPQVVKPHEALRQATEDSRRIIERGSRRIAYLHVWSWTSVEIQQTVLQAIVESNQQSVDAFILDVRDGWGGASPHYLTLFSRDVPVLQALERDGGTSTYDAQIRKPSVILVNGGTKSGKEIIAYGAKKQGFAQLVGEPTGGAVVFGQPFCLSDGSLLYLAVADARVDGERLEGTGVKPDIEVPFDVRYAEGNDPQLERAIQLVSGK